MENNIVKTNENKQNAAITSQDLLSSWQGHRRLTRKVIEAFPEKELFTFSVGGMRPFSELVMEMIKMVGPGLKGVVTDQWKSFEEINEDFKNIQPATKEELLKLWDENTETLEALWKQIPEGRFRESTVAYKLYEGPVYSTIQYMVDNEIHHRGQGYVYLRALGIQPPFFWER
jgi:uncharacterized damage-inducible protein DinB